MNSHRLLTPVVAAAFCAFSAASATGEDATPLRVEVDGNAITVVASNAPINDVLNQLQAQSGFTLVADPSELQRPVTVTLEAVPWRDGLAKLLDGFRYALAMNLETEQPATLVILSEGFEVAGLSGDRRAETPASAPAPTASSPGKPAPNGANASLEEATHIANELAAQREDPLQHAVSKAREAAAKAQEAQEAAAKERARRAAEGEDVAAVDDDQPQDAYQAYADALRALGQFQDPERLEVLAPALGSRSRYVRGAALEALRDGTVSDAAVLDLVLSMAIGDVDPFLRRDALEVYVRYGDQADVLALVQALARKDGPTRDIAVREWLRIEQERADARLADEQVRQSKALR